MSEIKIRSSFWDQLTLGVIATAILIFMLLIPTHWLDSLTHYKNFILIGSVFCVSLVQLFRGAPQFRFSKLDAVFLSLVIWNFISFFWATNPSLVWPKAFTWLFLLGFYKCVSSLNFKAVKTDVWTPVLAGALIFNLLALTWFYFIISTRSDVFGFSYLDVSEISKYLNYNTNYIATQLALTLPFYLFLWNAWKRWRYVIICLVLVQLILLFGLNCRGAVLAVVAQVVVLGIMNLQKIKRLLWLLPLVIIVPLSSLLFVKDSQKFISHYNPIKGLQNDHDERLLLWEASVKVWKESIWAGKGSGNWVIEAPKYGQKLFYGFDSYKFYDHPHSIYFDLLSELGIVGLGLYLSIIIPVLLICLRNIRRSRNKDLYLILLLMLIGYLVVSSFFAVVYARRYFLVFHQVGLIFLLAVAVAFDEKKQRTSSTPRVMGSVVLLVVLCYAEFFAIAYFRELKANEYLTLRRKNLIEKAENLYNRVYAPNIYTTIHPRKSGTQVSLRMYHALDLWAAGKKREAINEMRRSIEDQPYHIQNWYHLGNMYSGMMAYEDAIPCYEKVYELNPTFFKAQIQLLKIYVKLENWREAKKLYHSANTYILKILSRYENVDLETQTKQSMLLFQKFEKYKSELELLGERINQN